MDGDDSRLAQLKRDLPVARQALDKVGAALGAARRQAAGPLIKAVHEVIAALGMAEARLEVEIEARPGEPHPDGGERVQLQLAANTGEPARPLVEVVSGGELSRLLLAVKRACGADPVPVCVYDEVDAGLGGTTGVVLGRYLAELGRQQQVICITHLPQIAAAADRQIHVSKAETGGRVRTSATTLAPAARRAELARMLGGAVDERTALAHADALLVGRPGPG